MAHLSSSNTEKPSVGRPRKFDRDEVVLKAMHVFWRNGYTQTSIDDLVAGTNVRAQSLYNTFGNKREIFVQALNLYLSTITQAVLAQSESKKSSLEGICAVFPLPSKIASLNQPPGCLMVMTGLEIANTNATDIGAIVDKQRVQAIACFKNAIKRGQKQGEINQSLNVLATAKHLTILLQGAQCDIRYGAADKDIAQLRESIRQLLRA